jgi:hypothetical protein
VLVSGCCCWAEAAVVEKVEFFFNCSGTGKKKVEREKGELRRSWLRLFVNLKPI